MSRFFCYFLFFVFCLSAQAKPRVAVWNPEQGTTSSRFTLDLEWLNQVALWLKESDIETAHLTTGQIEDAEQFSALKFDVLMLPGDAFPRRTLPALQRWQSDGGVLISLGAGPVPFLTAIENQGGTWTPSPVAPDKAWETSEIYHKVLGLVYHDVPARRDEGVRHEATPLFQKYLKQFLPENTLLPVIEQKLPSRWLAPRMGASIYPLIRSKRVDGAVTVPQLFIVQNMVHQAATIATTEENKAKVLTGVIAVSDAFTKPDKKGIGAFSKETVVALAHIAADLKTGALLLSPDDKVVLQDEEPGDEE